MKRICLFLLSIVGFSSLLHSQNTYPSMKWIWKPSFGYTISLSPIPQRYITDNLLGYSPNRVNFQFLSLIYFFNDNWGIECTGINQFIPDTNFEDKFHAALRAQTPKEYYIQTSPLNAGSAIINFHIGPVYKVEKDRHIFTVSLPILSITNMEANFASARLKKQNSHEEIQTKWGTNETIQKDFYTFSPKASFGYRVSKRLVLNLEVGYSLYKANFVYNETTKNLLPNEVSSKEYIYNDWINDISINAGLMVVLGVFK